MSPDPGARSPSSRGSCASRRSTWSRSASAETVFALSNGHIGLRGNLDEGEPHATPGTYLNSFYERRPLPYAEGGYGYPESGQTIINVTNGKIIRLLVDDEPFDLRYGQLHRHQRVLDLQSGTLTREVALEQPGGQDGQGAQRAAGLADPARRRRDLLRGRGRGPGADRRAVRAGGQRAAAHHATAATPASRPRCINPLIAEQHRSDDAGATLVHHTRHSGLRVAAAMDHEVRGPEGTKITSEASEDIGRTTVICRLEPGTCCAWSSTWPTAGRRAARCRRVHDQVRAGARGRPLHRLGGAAAASSATYLDDVLDHRGRRDRRRRRAAAGRPASRSSTCCRPGARAERRAIGAKGLTGAGLRRPHVLGHRDVLPAGALPPRSPTRRRTPCAGASRSCRWPTSGPSSWA